MDTSIKHNLQLTECRFKTEYIVINGVKLVLSIKRVA